MDVVSCTKTDQHEQNVERLAGAGVWGEVAESDGGDSNDAEVQRITTAPALLPLSVPVGNGGATMVCVSKVASGVTAVAAFGRLASHAASEG